MKKKRDHILFKSYGLVSDKDFEEGYKDFLEMNGLTEDDCCLDTYIRDECDDWYDCEKDNLNIDTEGRVIAIADLGFWNGRKWGYKVMENNVNECLYWASECDDIEIYADQYDIRSVQYHHDGHHKILYREMKPKLTDWQRDNFLAKIFEGKVTRKDIVRYTRSILPYVKKVYGW